MTTACESTSGWSFGLTRVWTPAQESRSAHGLLYFLLYSVGTQALATQPATFRFSGVARRMPSSGWILREYMAVYGCVGV
jgi:hypothetical protein